MRIQCVDSFSLSEGTKLKYTDEVKQRPSPEVLICEIKRSLKEEMKGKLSLLHFLFKFSELSLVIVRTTRNGHINLYCPRFKFESDGGKSFSVSITRLWNNVPSTIRSLPTLNSFKKSYRKLLSDSYDNITHFTIS